MRLEKTVIERNTSAATDILDLSSDVQAFVAACGLDSGWVMLAIPGSTAALTTIEFESGAVNDLKRAIDRMAPQGPEYEHDRRWGDGNGYSHVRAALMGPSLVLPFADGQIDTGTWQQIVLCDFDNRPRRRRIHVQVLGD